jgi:hypothetical protein
MRHIKDIYSVVNEVRQRIIEKMRAENIVLVQFCPANEEEYLEEHKGEEHVENYEDYRDNHCPYVIWFDKYNSGEDCCVFSVSFIDGEHPCFKMQCEGEYDCRELFDDDVAWLTMLNVYESLERELGLNEVPVEPEKFRCAVVFGSRATSRYDEQDFEGLHEVCRDGDGSIVIREFDTEAERKAFIEGIEAGDGWCDYTEVDQTDIENVTFDDI